MRKIIIIVLILIIAFIIFKLGARSNGHKETRKGYTKTETQFTKSQLKNIDKVVRSVKVKSNTKYKVKGTRKIEGIEGTYVREVDGDTIVVRVKGKEEKVRFLMIDTPETVKRGTPVEPYGIQAKEFVKAKLNEGDKVFLVTGKSKTDKYGRYLAYVYYKHGAAWYNLNEQLVANGLARVGYVYEKHNELLPLMYKAEESARDQKINIWSIKGYVTERGYNLKAVS